MNLLTFTYNWNNKLNCHNFTTLRLANDKYVVGSEWVVKLNSQYRPYIARIIDKKQILLADVNEYIARLDTGYSRQACQDLIITMYKNAKPRINWDTQKLDFILLEFTKQPVTVSPELFKP